MISYLRSLLYKLLASAFENLFILILFSWDWIICLSVMDLMIGHFVQFSIVLITSQVFFLVSSLLFH